MFPELWGECEQLNNTLQISAAAATDGRPLTRYAENSRSNVARSGWRKREFGDQRAARRREFGGQGAANERGETGRAEQECRVEKGITELHRALDSAVKFGPGEEVSHLGSGAAHSFTGTSGTASVGRISVGSCA